MQYAKETNRIHNIDLVWPVYKTCFFNPLIADNENFPLHSPMAFKALILSQLNIFEILTN